MERINVIDLFCGAGGFSYGFQKAGFDILLGIDSYKPAIKNYKKNIKGADTLEKNIQKIKVSEVKQLLGDKEIHVVIGSPPCTEFSNSNQNKGGGNGLTRKKGRRWQYHPSRLVAKYSLAFEYFRFVQLIQPLFFVLENVPSFFETGLFEYCDNLIKKEGYTTNIQELNTRDYGIPQSRERVFYSGNRLTKDLVKIQKSQTTINIGEAINDLEQLSFIRVQNLNPNMTFSSYQKMMHAPNFKIYNHTDPGNKANTINAIHNTSIGSPYKSPNAKNVNNSHKRSGYSDISKLITGGYGSPSNDGETMHPINDRCLTHREAARLQSFDDCFIFHGTDPEIRELIGNAIPPLVARQYADFIMKTVKG